MLTQHFARLTEKKAERSVIKSQSTSNDFLSQNESDNSGVERSVTIQECPKVGAPSLQARVRRHARSHPWSAPHLTRTTRGDALQCHSRFYVCTSVRFHTQHSAAGATEDGHEETPSMRVMSPGTLSCVRGMVAETFCLSQFSKRARAAQSLRGVHREVIGPEFRNKRTALRYVEDRFCRQWYFFTDQVCLQLDERVFWE